LKSFREQLREALSEPEERRTKELRRLESMLRVFAKVVHTFLKKEARSDIKVEVVHPRVGCWKVVATALQYPLSNTLVTVWIRPTGYELYAEDMEQQPKPVRRIPEDLARELVALTNQPSFQKSLLSWRLNLYVLECQ
jgi:hypothetical protein